MRIVKKINNNVALAEDDSGKELVVFGKGVGFPPMPYELDDDSSITRVFRDVDGSVMSLGASISDAVLLASSDIVELAKLELGCRLNPNLVFTLGDHLQFAIDRLKSSLHVDNPLGGEIALVYPRESEVGRQGVGMVLARTGIELPTSESFSIALHVVEAESEPASGQGNMNFVMETTKIIDEVTQVIEERLGRSVDRTSYGYVRFTAHFRYLVRRLMSGAVDDDKAGEVFRTAARDFPEAYSCALEVSAYLRKAHGWSCSKEELLYLTMHINRLQEAQ
jgi:beta-glucoside operon transcriptional antiterminator